MGIESWWAAGEPVKLELSGIERDVFVRKMGSGGPSMTLLHGFPSSSYDWAKVAPALSAANSLLMPDFLGFGASEKPPEHGYSLLEQADLVEALWAVEGVGTTLLVAHDIGASVAQELLARRAEGGLSVDLVGVHLLNGGLYPDLHRPVDMQTALLDPETGPQISAMLNEELWLGALRPSFGAEFDPVPDSLDIWQATSRSEGHLIAHRLIRYILDRRAHEQRWVTALETTDVPLAFIWGMQDPISGAHMAERIRERIPHAQFTALDDVGHWPPLEAPARVAEAVLGRAHAQP